MTWAQHPPWPFRYGWRCICFEKTAKQKGKTFGIGIATSLFRSRKPAWNRRALARPPRCSPVAAMPRGKTPQWNHLRRPSAEACLQSPMLAALVRGNPRSCPDIDHHNHAEHAIFIRH